MGLLKRKEEKSETIAVRVPASLKGELVDLRKQADAAGFDLTATVIEALTRLTRQVRSELVGLAGNSSRTRRAIDGNEEAGAGLANGRAA
jgi:hypothetical protein